MTWAGVNSIRYLPVFWGDRSGQRSSKTIVFFHSIASRLFLGEGGHTLQQLDKDRSIGQKPFFFFYKGLQVTDAVGRQICGTGYEDTTWQIHWKSEAAPFTANFLITSLPPLCSVLAHDKFSRRVNSNTDKNRTHSARK